jgi:hypothetical protein
MCAGVWEINGKAPPCDTCADTKPEILEANEDLWQCLVTCESQIRASMSGPYGLDWAVIIEAAKVWPITLDKTFFRLLAAFERTMMREINGQHNAMQEA